MAICEFCGNEFEARPGRETCGRVGCMMRARERRQQEERRRREERRRQREERRRRRLKKAREAASRPPKRRLCLKCGERPGAPYLCPQCRAANRNIYADVW
ncbi:MAG: hypothetical protein JRI59_06005 [Deltaproteobacteria bacterium]|nr:hypothetical protein [Deltaproteobacteria bacterium]